VDEKELTKHYDRVNAERRRLPMVKIEKDYVFDGPGGKRKLATLFDGRRQLVVYHFMFDPAWDKGCPGRTSFINALGDLSMLKDRDTTFVVISRASLGKLEAYKAEKGWSIAWFSSFGNDFNYDLSTVFRNVPLFRSLEMSLLFCFLLNQSDFRGLGCSGALRGLWPSA